MIHAGRTVRVRVPATSANLGPGFDAAGLALARYDEVEAEVTGAGLVVEVDGEGAGDVPRDDGHLVVRALHAALGELGERPPGLALRCVNTIPHGRGLGSSAAAIVAGVVLGRALAGVADPAGAGALPLAARLEGHPDNVAACLLGGFTLSFAAGGSVGAVRLVPAEGLAALAVVPPHRVSTHEARRLLPDTVPHADAAANAARAALLAPAVTGRPDLLLAATEDRLHQDYRRPAMPETSALVERLRAAGHPAAVSGAGPAVLVLGTAGELRAAAATAVGMFPAWQALQLSIDLAGAALRDDVTSSRGRGTRFQSEGC
ncbi:MAG: homoserine kinase [Acidothermales bacterium]|nr:homoserine kinase [Acidothermales bacterium]